MDEWVDKTICVRLLNGSGVQGKLLAVSPFGDLFIETRVEGFLTTAFIPERSYEYGYIAPDAAVVAAPKPPQDDWSGEATSNRKLVLVNG